MFQGYNYLQGRLDLQFPILGIPLSAGGLVTTANPYTTQPHTQYYIRLDAQKIQKNLNSQLAFRQAGLAIDSVHPPVSQLNTEELNIRKLTYADAEKRAQLLKKLKPEAQAQCAPKMDSLQELAHQKASYISRMDSLSKELKSSEHLKAYQALQDSVQRLDAKEDLLVNSIALYTNRIDSLQEGLPDTPRADKEALLQKYLQNPGSVSTTELYRHGLISKRELLMSYIKKVQLGTVFPEHSEFTLAGAPLTGMHLVVEPGSYHIAASLLKNTQQPINPLQQGFFRPRFRNALSQIQYARNLYALSLGAHMTNGVDLKIHSLSATDIPNNGDNTLTPKSNRVLSITLNYQLKTLPLTLSAEAAAAATVLDNQTLKIRETDWPLTQELNPDSLYNKDIALKFNAKYRLNASTGLNAGYQKVGAQYFSAGNLFLRTGIERFSGGIEKLFFKDQIRTITELWYENLLEQPGNGAGGSATVQTSFRRLPVFTLTANYFNSQMQNAVTENAYSLASYSLTAGATYSFKALGKEHQASLAVGYQTGVSDLDTANNVIYYINFNYGIRVNRKLSCQLQASNQKTQYFDSTYTIQAAELGSTYKLNKRTTLAAKLLYTHQTGSFKLYGLQCGMQTLLAQKITFHTNISLYYATKYGWIPRVQTELRYAF